MSAERENLSDYVRRVMRDKALNYREVARRSGGLSHTTVFDVVNQRSKDIKTETLLALAKGLGVSEEEIFAVARGKQLAVRDVEVSADDLQDRTRRRELMALLFDDLPDECQFDTLASMVGVHSRRGLSLKIYQRSGARSDTLLQITRLISELLPASPGAAIAGEDTATRGRDVAALPPHPPGEVFVPGALDESTADDLAGDEAFDETEHPERERKSA